MGFDIAALKKGVVPPPDEFYDDPAFTAWEQENTVASFHTYMGAFRMLREQGFDWFALLGASRADGGASGTGERIPIPLFRIREALRALDTHDPAGRRSSEGRDEWSGRKHMLREFMVACIQYCEGERLDMLVLHFY